MARRTKISFVELVEHLTGVKEVELDSDMFTNPQHIKPEIVYKKNMPPLPLYATAVSLGFVALNEEDKFYIDSDGGGILQFP